MSVLDKWGKLTPMSDDDDSDNADVDDSDSEIRSVEAHGYKFMEDWVEILRDFSEKRPLQIGQIKQGIQVEREMSNTLSSSDLFLGCLRTLTDQSYYADLCSPPKEFELHDSTEIGFIVVQTLFQHRARITMLVAEFVEGHLLHVKSVSLAKRLTIACNARDDMTKSASLLASMSIIREDLWDSQEEAIDLFKQVTNRYETLNASLLDVESLSEQESHHQAMDEEHLGE